MTIEHPGWDQKEEAAYALDEKVESAFSRLTADDYLILLEGESSVRYAVADMLAVTTLPKPVEKALRDSLRDRLESGDWD